MLLNCVSIFAGEQGRGEQGRWGHVVSVRLADMAARRPSVLLAALLASLCFVFGATASVADEGSYHPMRFDRITQSDGLSQSNVFAIHQDSSGFMWFGTENGLNRYDGYEMEVFKRDRGNPDALGSDYIYDIAESSEGVLWIATNGGGLVRFDSKQEIFRTFRNDPTREDSIASNVVRTLLVDADGSIWLGTLGAGVDRFDPKTGVATNYSLGHSADPSRDVNEVYVLFRSGATMWAGTNDGLVALDIDSGNTTHYQHNENDTNTLSDHKVRAILEDSQGNLWVGTYNGGLNRLDTVHGSFERFAHEDGVASSLSGDRVTSLFEDADARLWVGTYNGLNLFDREANTFVRYSADARDVNSLSDDKITTMFQDRSSMLWIGTRQGGVNKWNPRSWGYGLQQAKALTASGDIEPDVTSFVEDKNGTLWIGTFGDGLHAVNRANGATTTYRNDPADANSINDDRVMSLALDDAGHLWVGTVTGGLNRMHLETGTVTAFTHDEENPASLSANGIMAIFVDSRGQVWAGTYGGGASRFDAADETFTRFLPSDETAGAISSNRVRAFAEDSAGFIWVGTDSGGLNLFNPKSETFHHFRHDPNDPKTLADDTVYSIAVGQDDTVWLGTQGGGLDRVIGSPEKPEQIEFVNLSHKDGLSNDVIYGVEVDNNGSVWVSTNFGVNRYDPATGEIKNLHRKDGLQSEEFNSGAHYQSAHGELFFGGPYGYNAFEPEEVKANSVIPLIALTGLFNGGDRVKADHTNNGVDLSYKDDTVSFEFAALDYADSPRNQYRYKLEGFDKEWIELGNRRRVTYTDLDDGKYLLRVQAANADGVWNEAGLSVPVSVSPAPWQTWWAYLGYAVTLVQFALFLWLGHRRKVRREEEYSCRLEEEVRERTQRLLESNQKLKELNHTLQESSLSDPLTGLRNRRFVFEEVSRDLDVVRRKLNDEEQGHDPRKSADLVFMMIDLDNFKPINDTYGHAAGDQMLLEVRDVLLGTCRKSDFVVRWGGDEFVVIAKQAKPGESEALAERIRSKIANHSFLLSDGQVVRTTCSIGFAAYPLHRGQAEDADLDAILTMADGLMYEAKRHRNAWAGILGPAAAATSFDFDHDSIEPTSILYRAKHAGHLIAHDSDNDDKDVVETVSAAG